MRVLIVGSGYVGFKLASDLARHGHEVLGVTRTSYHAPLLNAAGIVPLSADVSVPESCANLPRDCDWVVLCVSTRGGGVSEYERTYLQSARNLLQCMAKIPPAKFVFTSSTSVYGQTDGSMVDESSPANPLAPSAQVLLQTETLLCSAAVEHDFPAVVLRVGAIYGPQRTHWIERIQKGLGELDLCSNRLMNMIHRDDVAGAIVAALKRGKPGEIYNAVDDAPVRQADLLQWLSCKLHKPCEPVGHSLTSFDSPRLLTSKAVSNRKLKLELGYTFKFPTFREGYLSILNAPSPSDA
jgi:nucleoside-diphosphate-sugar epimerase